MRLLWGAASKWKEFFITEGSNNLFSELRVFRDEIESPPCEPGTLNRRSGYVERI